MARLITTIIMAAMLAGCTQRTVYGQCVGLFSSKDPQLVYEFSFKNLLIGTILVETIIVPVVVGVGMTYCPVAKRYS